MWYLITSSLQVWLGLFQRSDKAGILQSEFIVKLGEQGGVVSLGFSQASSEKFKSGLKMLGSEYCPFDWIL